MTGVPWIALGATACSAVLTAMACRLLRRVGAMAEPNARSSHERSVPTGVGIAFVAAASAAWLLAAAINGRAAGDRELAVAGLAIAILGLADDRHPLPALPRLAVQLCAAAWVAWTACSPAVAEPSWALIALASMATLAVAWSTNLFNFMDGTDGLAALQGLCIASGGAWLIARSGKDPAVPAAIAGALVGFLPWNLPRARAFMGDAGSTWLGFTLAALALRDSVEHPGHLPAWLLLAMPFVVDATTCLVTRVLRGRNPARAHRSHAYQILARRWKSHGAVLAAYGTAMAACMVTAWATVDRPTAAWLACVACYGLGAGAAISVGSGRDGIAEHGHSPTAIGH